MGRGSQDLQHDHWKDTFHGIHEAIDLACNARCALLRSLEGIRNGSCDTDQCQGSETYFGAPHQIFEQS